MRPEIVVRAANENDRSVIKGHRAKASEEARQYRGTPALISEAPTHSYVAMVGETVMGSLTLVESTDRTATIIHVFVEPEAREIGIGDSLVSHVINELVSRGITHLAASAQPGDRSLKNLYERHGLVAQTIMVGKPLSDPSTEECASQ